MLRVGQKRRRTKTEIAGEKEEARIREEEIQQKLQQLEQLKQQAVLLQRELESHKSSTDILNDLQSKNKIKLGNDGQVIITGIDD